MKFTTNRRQFLGSVLAAGVHIASSSSARSHTSANEKLNLAFVGVGNRGGDNLAALSGQNVVALCDVDATFLGKAAMKHPDAKQYRDYRKLLDAEGKRLDGVVVATADHTHAPIAAAALSLGKHVYCEKPLAHTVREARTLAQLAAKNKLATQMGTQIHATDNYRRVVELIQGGAIGPVREVHAWCNKDWSGGKIQPAGKSAPANLDWDVWLGPAQAHPYLLGVHPQNWRRFWEFGAGTLGDMACHVLDLPFWALDLRYPTRIKASGSPIDPVGAAAETLVEHEFPAQDKRAAVKLTWSDGGKHHPLVTETKDAKGKALSSWGLGVLFVGEKGMLAADYGRRQLLPTDQFAGFTSPSPSIPKSIGHWEEWVQACKSGTPTSCNFDYSGRLTESVLLGVVAFRSGEPLTWDAKALKVTNSAKAQALLSKEYRKGFEVPGLI